MKGHNWGHCPKCSKDHANPHLFVKGQPHVWSSTTLRKRCRTYSKNHRILHPCSYCQKMISDRKSEVRKYCSFECYQKGRWAGLSERKGNPKGNIPWSKGKKLGPRSEEIKAKYKLIRQKYLDEHPEAHPIMKMLHKRDSTGHYQSIPQQRMFATIREAFPEAVFEHVVGKGRTKKFIDVALVSKHIDVEYDGERWHDKQKDFVRDKVLRSLGWIVYRFNKHNIQHLPKLLEFLKRRGID